MDALEETIRVASSKPVQRAAVNTVLVVSSAATLFCVAAIATGLFFRSFVPDLFVTTPVHLQYGSGPNPYGVASLTKPPRTKTQQEYDIAVTLSMPRSPANLERGNFMISLYLLGSEPGEKLEADARHFASAHQPLDSRKVMFRSRRPALVPYVDPLVSVAKRVLFLLYHMFVPSTETCEMHVTMAERLAFAKDAELPASAYVEVEAGQDIQIYSAALVMMAQLRGLRWLMFHYRTPAYLALTFFFWACEVLFMGLAWAAWAAVMGSWGPWANKGDSLYPDGEDDDGPAKDDFSDHPPSFPGKRPAPKPEPEVKEEEAGQGSRSISDIPAGGAEADDEGGVAEAGGGSSLQYGSGLGTSYSEQGSGSVRRRASRSGNVMGGA